MKIRLTKEFVSKRLKENIDSLVLQEVKRIINDRGMINGDLEVISLKSCPHCNKQWLYMEGDDEVDKIEECVWRLNKALDDNIVVYKQNSEITYALESELNIA